MEILKNIETGRLVESFKGFDADEYTYATAEDFIEAVENADRWDDIDNEVYAEMLDRAGLDYSSYDDPDAMWA